MPYFKGDPIPDIRQFKNIQKDGYNIIEMKIGTHTGTHIDAPSHFIEGGKTVDQLDLSDLMGKATVVRYDPNTGLRLPKEISKIVFLYTGYNSSWNNFKTFEDFSYINPEDATVLRDGGAKVVGIDSPSAEMPNSKNFDTHHILLGSSIPIVENLKSEALSMIVNRSINIHIIPILVKGGDGAPARVFAMES